MFMPRMMQFSGTMLADWLTSSAVGDDVISIPDSLSSDCTAIEGDITEVKYCFIHTSFLNEET